MKKYVILLLILPLTSFSQTLTGKQLLDKAIAYHDPNNHWSSFSGTFKVTLKMPKASNRDTKITINLPEEYFNSVASKDSVTTTYTINKGECIISKADSLKIANQTTKPKRSHCETANLYKNYYTYLYGLPMKLKDPGTNINDKVELKNFSGNDYLVLKVTYDETVGSDVWYFYFDPETYAMQVYQFYKTDDKGKIKTDSGEYIVLTDEEIISSIKMPKVRAWYYNKNDAYLGTDVLQK